MRTIDLMAAVLLAALLAGGTAAAFTLPESGAVEGWVQEGPPRRFTAAGLYGHINGGAELFLELGFVELLVQSYARDGREISLEVYRMESPLAALAIYLFKCGEETPWPEIGTRNSSSRFQAALLRGDCYVLVNSFSGDRDLRPAMVGLAGKLLEAIPGADPGDPFAALSAEGRVAGSERLVRGEFSLQSLYTLGPGDVLQLGGETFGIAADYVVQDSDRPETRVRVVYPGPVRASAAFDTLKAALDPELHALETSKTRLLFRDFAGRFGLVMLEGDVVEVRVNLATRPGDHD